MINPRITVLLPVLAVSALLSQHINAVFGAQEQQATASQTPAAPEQPDPVPGQGVEVFKQVCSGCHSTSTATSLRKTKADWASIVDDMRSRGANGTDEDFDQVIQYLSTNYGTKPQPAHVNVNSATATELKHDLDLSAADGEAIVNYRSKNGVFKDLVALERVPGVDISKLEKAKDRIDF